MAAVVPPGGRERKPVCAARASTCVTPGVARDRDSSWEVRRWKSAQDIAVEDCREAFRILRRGLRSDQKACFIFFKP